ncbi:MFS family permease [Desmospora profundinema]|uniref:MFS family permease n=2 Tax=Desmospora profundinema TaxID=1571184 RepID=A0ABU1IK37_9BACL|nr:MFS family permease [Desmospora profundinema]
MLYVVLPIFWSHLGLSSLWQVGVLLSVNRLIRIPVHPLVGWFYKRFPIKYGLLLAILLTVVSTFSYGFARSFELLFIMRCLWGIAWAFLKQAGQYSLIEGIQQTGLSGKLTGVYNGLSRTGSLAGMLIGGLFAGMAGIHTISLLFAFAAVWMVPLVWFYFPDRSSDNQSVVTATARTSDRIFRVGRYTLFLLLAGLMISMVYQGLLKSMLSLWIEQQDISSVLWIGGIGAAALAGILQAMRWAWEPLIAPWVGKVTDRNRLRLPTLAATLIIGSVLIILISTHLPAVGWLVGAVLLLVTATINTTLLDATAVEHASSASKRAVMIWYSMTLDIGAALGPVLGYAIASLAVGPIVQWGAAILLILSAGFTIAMERIEKGNPFLQVNNTD